MSKYFLLLILVVCFIFTSPFFHKGYFPTHDGGWAVVRLAEMVRELKDFQFPPRWSDYLNHGYGYPLFQYTYPLPYYAGALLKSSGIGLVDSIKILFVLSMFLSAVCMYLLAAKVGGAWGGFLAAVFYSISPYRLSNLYIRGSLGESLSLIFYPLLFLLSIKLTERFSLRKGAITSFVFAFLILTHNVSALLFLPVWIGFTLIFALNIKKKNYVPFLKHFLFTILLGFGIAAYFFLPAILEKGFIALSEKRITTLSDNFIHLIDYVVFPNTISSTPIFYQGLFLILAFVLVFVTFLLVKSFRNSRIIIFLLITLVLYIMISTSSTTFLWNLPPLSWIDFPWRSVNVILFLLSLSTAFLGSFKRIKWLGLLLLICALFQSMSFLKVSVFEYKSDDYYATNDATTTAADELMPLWVHQKPTDRYLEKVQVIRGDASLSNIKYSSRAISFTSNSSVSSTLQINTIYFPNWTIYLDSKKVIESYKNELGVIQIDVSSGEHDVKGFFEDTSIRKITNMLSIISIGCALYFVVKKSKKSV